MENKFIDARGLSCPLPVVNAKKAIEAFREDGSLTVLVDNEIAVQNLQKFAARKGLQAHGEKKGDREYQVTFQVVAGAPLRAGSGREEAGVAEEATENDQKLPCSPDSRRKGLVAVLSANVMGGGDAKLGTALMKAFVFALTRQDVLPETVLCYNSGAFLTCQGSDSLEDFKALEAEGVRILTCGTCLDFYGLKEKLAVGSVTNMYEIVEIMEEAKSLIRP